MIVNALKHMSKQQIMDNYTAAIYQNIAKKPEKNSEYVAKMQYLKKYYIESNLLYIKAYPFDLNLFFISQNSDDQFY